MNIHIVSIKPYNAKEKKLQNTIKILFRDFLNIHTEKGIHFKMTHITTHILTYSCNNFKLSEIDWLVANLISITAANSE